MINVLLNTGFKINNNGDRIIFNNNKLNELKINYKLLISYKSSSSSTLLQLIKDGYNMEEAKIMMMMIIK